jgi:hypothetical protein
MPLNSNIILSQAVQVLTSLTTGALYLGDLNVPLAIEGYFCFGYNMNFNLGAVCLEVHIHCNK